MLIGYKIRSKIYDKIASQKVHSIIMFGDAFTAAGNWNKDLNRNDIKNNGRPSLTTSQFLWILNNAVIKFKPKICFIEGGLNDIEVGMPLNRTFMNYQSIVDSLLKHDIEPVLQSTLFVDYPSGNGTNMPRPSETKLINLQVDSLNKYLSILANKKGIMYIDLNQYLSENGKLKKEVNTDGVHLNEYGYKIWAREIDKVLKKNGL